MCSVTDLELAETSFWSSGLCLHDEIVSLLTGIKLDFLVGLKVEASGLTLGMKLLKSNEAMDMFGDQIGILGNTKSRWKW